MTDHDPLCPWSGPCPGRSSGGHEFIPNDAGATWCYHCTSTECQCDLIARVRADEPDLTEAGSSIKSATEDERPCVECVVVEREQSAEKRAVAEFLRGQIAGLELTLKALEDDDGAPPSA